MTNNLNSIKTKSKLGNVFECYREILKTQSSAISITQDEISINDILLKQYNKFVSIDPNSVLYKYLNNNIKPATFKKPNNIIYPFGINSSQQEAVEKALMNQVSIIEGPPGTGKTQTILNIIANLIYNDKNVAVVSNNSSAVENVLEKLKKCNLDFLCAFLGNKSNKKAFIETQKLDYPLFENTKVNINNLKKDNISLIKYLQKNYFKDEHRKAKLKTEILNLEPEFLHFKENIDNFPIRYVKIKSKDSAFDYLCKFEQDKKFSNTIINDNIKTNPSYLDRYGCIKNLQYRYYGDTIEKLQKEMHCIDLDKYEDDKNKLKNNSMNLLNEKIKYRFSNKKKNLITNLSEQSKEVVDEYPIILSTTFSLKNSLDFNFLYDYVIVDEASQGDLITGLLALSCAKNIVIVGDSKQLPNIIDNDKIPFVDKICNKYQLNDNYRLLENVTSTNKKPIKIESNSLLKSMHKVFNDARYYTLLREHYRCAPKIINFCNKKFYDDQLLIMSSENKKDTEFSLCISNNDKSTLKVNNSQIKDIVDDPNGLLCKIKNFSGIYCTENYKKIISYKYEDIGIIAPYNKQVDAINNKLIKENNGIDIKVSTVHKFQGQERDAIIISSVDNKISKFADDPKLLNVAVSRAKKHLALTIDGNPHNLSTNFGDLRKYIEYYTYPLKLDTYLPILEYLYNHKIQINGNNSNKKTKLDKYFDYIIKMPRYSSIKYIKKYFLYDLIKDISILSEHEQTEVSNGLKLDYVIYDNMNKMPICGIEIFSKKYPRSTNKILISKIMNKINIPYFSIDCNEDFNKQFKKIFKNNNIGIFYN